ncbi:Serine/Threonine-Protein Kinase Mark1 [Manis pentadactyla]|nr:Serine/Threonine-Protein Kinase Mark1 [Manis pentadactyla]
MWDPAAQSLIEMFEFVALTPYKALFLEALLTPRPHRAPPGSSHPRESQIPLLKKGGKARRRQRRPGTATRRAGDWQGDAMLHATGQLRASLAKVDIFILCASRERNWDPGFEAR